jgi:hypothetical protein
LNGCTLSASEVGLQLTKGSLVVDHKVTVHATGDDEDTAITFGDGTADNDLIIHYMPGASIEVTGWLDYKNVD